MRHWRKPTLIRSLALVCLLLSGCSSLAGDQDIEGPLVLTVLGGVVVPEEGPPREGGYALEGEDVMSPGPTIVARAGQQVTITFKVADEIVLEPHDFVIVAEQDKLADPLWGAQTDKLRFGEQQTITFTPDTPGTYFYICSVSDHLHRGMWGSFVAEE